MNYYASPADYGAGLVSERDEYTYDDYGRRSGFVRYTSTSSSGSPLPLVGEGQGVRATVADDPNFTVERTELSLYDNRGRMLHMITPEGKTSYNYDDLGRMTYTAINADLSAIDSATGVDSLPADPTTAERVTAYGYDILGRLVSVQEDATPSDDTDATQDTDYGFDLQGRMARMVTGTTHQVPSLMTVMAYDSLGRLDTMVDSDGAGNITASYDYNVRADGRRTSSTETFWIDDNEDGEQTANELKAILGPTTQPIDSPTKCSIIGTTRSIKPNHSPTTSRAIARHWNATKATMGQLMKRSRTLTTPTIGYLRKY